MGEGYGEWKIRWLGYGGYETLQREGHYNQLGVFHKHQFLAFVPSLWAPKNHQNVPQKTTKKTTLKKAQETQQKKLKKHNPKKTRNQQTPKETPQKPQTTPVFSSELGAQDGQSGHTSGLFVAQPGEL